MIRKILLTALIFTSIVIAIPPDTALSQDMDQSETLEGTVEHVIQETIPTETGNLSDVQHVQVRITNGSLKNSLVSVTIGTIPLASQQQYAVGDRVVLLRSKNADGADVFFITDYVRRPALYALFAVFVILAILIGGKWGFAALGGMVVSFLVIFFFILPNIINGKPPVVIALLGGLVIVPVTFYLSHGFGRKTHIAVVGTILSLSITGIIASITIDGAHLTGFATEEAGFLKIQRAGIDMKGLLLAGIIIGVLGILDDVTVSQTSVVKELKRTNSRLSYMSLFSRAMTVGRDHIASLVNTLVLVYTGASLPLLLLFIDNPRPPREVINYEFVADEIIRMLVGSIGLILAVPITTALAAYIYTRYRLSK